MSGEEKPDLQAMRDAVAKLAKQRKNKPSQPSEGSPHPEQAEGRPSKDEGVLTDGPAYPGPDPERLADALRRAEAILFASDEPIDAATLAEALPQGVEALMLPAESSFRDGTSAWTIEALDAAHARVTVTARQTPRFWIPPLLGPAILKRVFLEEVTESCANIEKLALAAAAP